MMARKNIVRSPPTRTKSTTAEPCSRAAGKPRNLRTGRGGREDLDTG
jgi:hypothetical protein